MEELTPKQIVQELDKYVIGQVAAKRSVAIALRNRFRRQQTPDYFKDEIIPNNILMIGPTGVGKTEIARRIAKLVKAPFVKVEASKFTEVGYVGRDVESMIRDLMEISISIVKEEKAEDVKKIAVELANKQILDKLMPPVVQQDSEDVEDNKDIVRNETSRNILLAELLAGKLDEKFIELEVSPNLGNSMKVFGPFGQMEEMGGMFQTLMDNFPKTKKKRRMKIKEAREILIQEETQKLIDDEAVNKEALFRAETAGIVFIDEIDKIAGKDNKGGADVSREGVQQDLLPIVEGSTVATKYGTIKTDHILFIASGAFHVAKPSDLIAELQGRFPIRVELQSLNENDLVKILTEPKNALIRQYIELVKTEGITLKFTDDAISELAHVAAQANTTMENIGARRLNTVLSLVLEDIMFDAPEDIQGDNILIDVAFVRSKLSGIIKDENLSSYIL